MQNLYYELTSDGYHIYDRNDSFFHIHQYEPYIPDKSKSYEENAKAQMHELMLYTYVSEVTNGSMQLADVPEEYKTEVETIINQQSQKLYTLDEAAAIIASEVSHG